MRLIAFDTETLLIRTGLQTPPIVCLTWAQIEDGVVTRSGILDRHEGKKALREWLEDETTYLIGANTAFDLLCPTEDLEFLRLVFDALSADRVTDVLVRQKLLDIAAGCYRGKLVHGFWQDYGYSLADCAQRLLGRFLSKDADTWRLRYGELWDVSIDAWPADAVSYAVQDAVTTAQVFLAQQRIPPEIEYVFPGRNPLDDEYRQTRGAFWLKLMSAYGIRTDADTVKVFAENARAEYLCLCEELVQEGLVRRELPRNTDAIVKHIKQNNLLPVFLKGEGPTQKISLTRAALLRSKNPELGMLAEYLSAPNEAQEQALVDLGFFERKYTRNTKVVQDLIVQANQAQGREPKLTKPKRSKDGVTRGGGNIAIDAETCREAEHPLLEQYADLTSLAKTLSTDLKFLEFGAKYPIHSNFEVLLKTGRTGSSAPNIQNIRRLEGIRECFRPRPGYVFVDADYGKLELHTLAQICLWWFGHSALAQALNAGRDPHAEVASLMLGITYEEGKALDAAGDKRFANVRNAAKVANFGYPGGLGIETFVSYAKTSYKVTITREMAREIKEVWLRSWPEMQEYFAFIRSSLVGPRNHKLSLPYSNRLSQGDSYCAACNKPFQGLGADVGKLAGWFLARECYVEKDSPLFGCRPVNFVHDQFLIETPEERAHEAAVRTQELMNHAGALVLPDVPVKTKPLLSRIWSKNSKRLIGPDGRLIPWQPDHP